MTEVNTIRLVILFLGSVTLILAAGVITLALKGVGAEVISPVVTLAATGLGALASMLVSTRSGSTPRTVPPAVTQVDVTTHPPTTFDVPSNVV